MAAQLGFYFDASTCIGCKACQTACQDKNDLPADIAWRRVFHYSGGNWLKSGSVMVPSNVFSYYVTVSCQHCQDAACVQVCPTTAMQKDENGIVSIDPDKCIGCRYCEWACPYGAPQFDAERGVMTKCHFCYERLDAGEKPACVDGCTYRALDFGPIDELRAKYGDFASPAPLPDQAITTPSIVYSPTPHTLTHDSSVGAVMNAEEL